MKLYLSEESFKPKLNLNDNSVSYIYSCHFLQKFTKEELIQLLKECKRVLQPGEVMRISVPDYYLLSDKYLKSKCKIDEINKVLEGSKIFFDFILMQKLLTQVGFYAVKRFNPEKFDLEDKSTLLVHGEIISLNVEAYG